MGGTFSSGYLSTLPIFAHTPILPNTLHPISEKKIKKKKKNPCLELNTTVFLSRSKCKQCPIRTTWRYMHTYIESMIWPFNDRSVQWIICLPAVTLSATCHRAEVCEEKLSRAIIRYRALHPVLTAILLSAHAKCNWRLALHEALLCRESEWSPNKIAVVMTEEQELV